MKTIIKIDRSTLKRNPNAGRMQSNILMGIDTDFKTTCTEIEAKGLELVKDIHIASITYPVDGNVIVYGFIDSPDYDFTKLPGKWEVESKKNIQTVNHLPIEKYIYKYEQSAVKCSMCGHEVLHSEIEQECDDYTCYDVCPNCEKTDTFDYYYESIFIVAKELNL